MECCHLILVLLFLLCSVQGIEDSEAKSTRELDTFSNSRKILQTNNQAGISTSPYSSPVKNHHHHHYHQKHKRIPISPSPSPLQNPNLKSQITKPNPNSKPQNRTVPLHSSGFIVSPSSESNSSSHIKHAKNWRIYASIFGGASLFLLVLIIIFIFIRAKKVVTVKPWATGLSGQLQKAFVTGVPALKRTEIENACEYFSNIIGSFGKNCIMYKGTLSSGVEIAVVSTLLKDWSNTHQSHFRNKITSLSRVNHKNFVNLLGFCEESRPFTRMMVFEYAPNGTLFEHLHNEEMGSLDWATRLRIAVGIAYCLDHMHQLDPPVLLTNLDSSTVYLTDDLAAKVSDLNLWSKDQNTLDKETLVYKYGLLLLEILTGDLQFNSKHDPLVLSRPLIVDSRVGDFDEGNLGKLREVARECCDLEPKKRPTMGEVARRMREITEMPPHGAVPKVSPLWWAELEIMSPVNDE